MNSSVQAYWHSGPCESGESPNETNPAEFFRTHARIRYEREREIMPFAEFGLPGEMRDYNCFRSASAARRFSQRDQTQKIREPRNEGPVRGGELERVYMTADAVIQPHMARVFRKRLYLE